MSELKTNLEQILQEKETKIIPENIKKDIQIFDVIGTYEGSGQTTSGVKLFETEESMQADSSAKEGDLAVVYRSEIQNMTADTQTQYITFPETVKLPTAFSGSASCTFNPGMVGVRLSQSSFSFSCFTGSGYIQIRIYIE